MARSGNSKGSVDVGAPRCTRPRSGRLGCPVPTTSAFVFLGFLLSVSAPGVTQHTLPDGVMVVGRPGPAEGLPGSYIPDLATTGDGLLWMIASGRLTSFDGLVFEEHDVPEVSEWRGAGILGIGAGRADTLWLPVGPRLLSRVGGHTRLHAEHDMILRDVGQEDNGRIWAWDDLGVVRLEEAGFERVVELRAGWNWDWLAPFSDGTWSADDAWIQEIDPVAVRAQERTAPRVRITSITTTEGLRPPAPSVRLERRERRVDVAFAAALLSGQAGLRYEVLMEAVDPDWADVGGQRQVSYASGPCACQPSAPPACAVRARPA